MKLRFNRDFLDFKKGKEYDVTPENTAKYIVRMSIAKEVVGKGGKDADADKAAADKAAADKAAADKADAEEAESIADSEDAKATEKAEVKTAPKNKTEAAAAEKAEVKTAPKNKTEAAAKKKIVPGSDIDDLLGFDN